MTNHEKAGDYDILLSVRLGGREMLIGYNPHDKVTPYMTCYKEYNLLGNLTFPEAMASANYLEIMQIFLDRLQERQKEAEAFREGRNVPYEVLGLEHCRQRKNGESLQGKLVILRPSSLAAEYRTADCQLGYAQGGFGCEANAGGRAVYFRELYSGDRSRWEAHDILGLADVEKLPDWAKQKVAEHERSQKNIQEPER